ncbi:GMC family oxidoreductase [Pigmentiphaga litoralis]|uniref:GMC family oxidoreductase n=1 Tax=Pigmentiphaga litoralis TaxID=516702 RepID=UPI003B42F1B1
MIHIPLGLGRMLQKRSHDWGYASEAQDETAGRRIECARGRVIGGSSSINALAYVRGHRSDFDRWAARYGLTEWDAAHTLPYFLQLEDWQGPASPWRGKGGPITTRYSTYQDPLIAAYLNAAGEAGHVLRDDLNGEELSGFGRSQVTIRGGRRCSNAVAYLRPAMKRRGLTVRTHAMATRVEMAGGRATGVAYVRHGKRHIAQARREVLLAGGVINTPQLLMLSGIGDSEQLAPHGIDTRVALPAVGRNLQDHIAVLLSFSRKTPGPFPDRMRADRVVGDLARAWLYGAGAATNVPGGAAGYEATRPGLEGPDVQYLLAAAPFHAQPWLRPWRAPFDDGFAVRVVALHPESRGRVTLASAAPDDLAVVHQNFLAHESEWASLRAGIRSVRRIMTQPSMQPYVAEERMPGPDCLDDAALNAHIRKTAITVHHPCGTCRMGTDDDADAVVDARLRVRGVQALRIVDASVMPDLIGGNINATVTMIAEKAADLIRGRAPLAPWLPEGATPSPH